MSVEKYIAMMEEGMNRAKSGEGRGLVKISWRFSLFFDSEIRVPPGLQHKWGYLFAWYSPVLQYFHQTRGMTIDEAFSKACERI